VGYHRIERQQARPDETAGLETRICTMQLSQCFVNYLLHILKPFACDRCTGGAKGLRQARRKASRTPITPRQILCLHNNISSRPGNVPGFRQWAFSVTDNNLQGQQIMKVAEQREYTPGCAAFRVLAGQEQSLRLQALFLCGAQSNLFPVLLSALRLELAGFCSLQGIFPGQQAS